METKNAETIRKGIEDSRTANPAAWMDHDARIDAAMASMYRWAKAAPGWQKRLSDAADAAEKEGRI